MARTAQSYGYSVGTDATARTMCHLPLDPVKTPPLKLPRRQFFWWHFGRWKLPAVQQVIHLLGLKSMMRLGISADARSPTLIYRLQAGHDSRNRRAATTETARLEGMSTSSNPVVTSMYYNRAVLGKPFFGKPATQDLSSACQKLHMCQAETTAKQNQKNTGMEGF